MLIRKNIILLLLFALHATRADVFKTNEIPVVPAEDLVPPPEDQESLVVRHQNNAQIPKSFFQRVITWFGFNGEPQSHSINSKNAKKQTQKQQQQQQQSGLKQNGYVYENPAKPLSLPPQTYSHNGYNYNDPSKVILTNGFRFEPAGKLQQLSSQGYTYEPPPQKLELQPESGYTYDPPRPPVKLQQQPIIQPQNGYTYNPPPIKLQQPSSTGYTYNPPLVKLQEPPKPQPTGYTYDAPVLKLQQKPISLNDLISSAASPTALYAYNPLQNPNPFAQQATDSFPCNKIPWLPIFPSANELNLLRAKLQAKNPNYLQSMPGHQNIQPIVKPTPEKITTHLNAHTYLPPRQRPLRQPSQIATPNQINSINSINSLPLPSTAQPFRAPPPTISSSYLPAHKFELPIQTTSSNFVPVAGLSSTSIPPAYDPKPFTVNDAQENGIYINGRLVTPTGLSTTSVQSLQIINQNHPVTQSQKIVQPTNNYGAPVTGVYGTPPVTYGPPTNTYGTPPIRLTSTGTESSLLSQQFSASQPFKARPTMSSVDQSRLSSNVEQNSSNLMDKPIIISDNTADASESTRSPQDINTISDENQPILQVLQELNVTTTPQGFQYTPSSTEPSISISSANQLKKKEKVKINSNRETPIDLLDTPIQHYRKTSIGPSTTIDLNGLNDFNFLRNTWKPLPPNPFSNPLNVVTTVAPQNFPSPVTPSAASSAFQSHTKAHVSNTIENQDNDEKKTKKIQIIIPYTNKARPSPFKSNQQLQSFDSSAGWSNSPHNDDHNSEESQVISAATPSPKPTTTTKRTSSRYLTKILAKNIRELLKREHLKNISTINLEKLQKNIDGWTEQEFSMSPNRASTISLLAQPKLIPYEYLTTTQSLQDLLTTESIQPTTEYPSTLDELNDNMESDENDDDDSQDEDEMMDDESEDENEIRVQDIADNIAPDEQEAIQQAEEIEDEDFKRLDYLKSLEHHVSGSHKIFYATNPPATSNQLKTTTPIPPCSTTTTTSTNNNIVRTTVLPTADELWNRLKSLLSPVTDKNNEKVYIVTPQPYPYFESEKIASDDDNEVAGNFKSPRFLVRPTPGTATGRSSSNSFARLTFKPRMNRLQMTTVKTTWKEPVIDPITEINHSSTHSHSVVNGHAHAQALSYVTPQSLDENGSQDVQVVDDDDDDDEDDEDDDGFIDAQVHRRSLHEYKH